MTVKSIRYNSRLAVVIPRGVARLLLHCVAEAGVGENVTLVPVCVCAHADHDSVFME